MVLVVNDDSLFSGAKDNKRLSRSLESVDTCARNSRWLNMLNVITQIVRVNRNKKTDQSSDTSNTDTTDTYNSTTTSEHWKDGKCYQSASGEMKRKKYKTASEHHASKLLQVKIDNSYSHKLSKQMSKLNVDDNCLLLPTISMTKSNGSLQQFSDTSPPVSVRSHTVGDKSDQSSSSSSLYSKVKWSNTRIAKPIFDPLYRDEKRFSLRKYLTIGNSQLSNEKRFTQAFKSNSKKKTYDSSSGSSPPSGGSPSSGSTSAGLSPIADFECSKSAKNRLEQTKKSDSDTSNNQSDGSKWLAKRILNGFLNKSPTPRRMRKKLPKKILRPPATYVYMRGMSGLPKLMPRSPQRCNDAFPFAFDDYHSKQFLIKCYC